MKGDQSGGNGFGELANHDCPCNKYKQMQTHLQRDKEDEMGRIVATIMILMMVAYFVFTLYLLKKRFNIEVKINIERDQEEGGEVDNPPPEGPMEDNVVWALDVHRLPNDDVLRGIPDGVVAIPVD